MKRAMNKVEKNKSIVKVIRMVWSSLETHLDDSYDPIYDKIKEKKAKVHIGGRHFQIQCCREYGEMIKILTDLLQT